MSVTFVWDKTDLTTNDLIPHQIQSTGDVAIRSINSGQNHTLVSLQDGSVHRCVHVSQQSNSNNIATNLGRMRGLCNQSVIQVAAGSSHSVVLTKAHQVHTWGKNDEGQLGRGDIKQNKHRQQPKLLKSIADLCVLQISCGNNHTLALTNDGLVFAWGSNIYGQLGLGISSDTYQNVPQAVSFLGGLLVLQVAAGGDHSFILSKSGAVFGWGRNDFGQLGLNSTENQNLPTKCSSLIEDQKIKYLSCGENHTACLTVDGFVFTFGAGGNFQLGHGVNENESVPRIVMGLSDSEVSQIACGSDHTLAYVSQSGILYVFGQGGSEQFGSSNTVSLASPFVISDNLHASYFSMKLGNQETEHRIKNIYAGGNQSFIITCNSDDNKTADPAKQILVLSEERINKLQCLSSNDSEEYFNNEEFNECSSGQHGVNLEAVRAFFHDLKKNKNLMQFILTKIEKNLIPMLTSSPQAIDVLRLYLILPECPLFDQPENYSSTICQFAQSFLSLDSSVMQLFDSWWSSNHPSFFERLVVIYVQCVKHLAQHSSEDTEINQDLIIPCTMLQKLYQVNEDKGIMGDTAFIVPELKNKYLQLQDYLFLFDAETKSMLFQNVADLQKKEAQAFNNLLWMLQGYQISPQNGGLDIYHFFLSINRENLVKDTFSQLSVADIHHLKMPLMVKFVGEKAYGDGVIKEYFKLLFQKIMDETFGMFTTDEISKLHYFNSLTQQTPEEFRMIGILCGLMIYNAITTDLHFPLAVYKKLLKKSVTLDDVKELIPVHGRGMQDVLDFDGDNEDDQIFDLTFVRETSDTEEHLVGTNGHPQDAEDFVNVTQRNRIEFIDHNVDDLLNKSVKTQFDAFSQGFHMICGGKILDSFHPNELQCLVEGNEDYDFEEFEKNTIYMGVYHHRRKIINFWKVFHEMSFENKKKFMVFLTGSDRISISGMKKVKMTIQPVKDERLLPVALTCHNLLQLPLYSTKEKLKSSLLMAIQQTEGFCRTDD